MSKVELPPGALVKTHDYPEAIAHRPEKLRVLFCFGSALEAALSVHLIRDASEHLWIERHFHNLGRPCRPNDLFHEDVLGQAAQLKAWCVHEKHPTFCVRYDALWDAEDEISEFFGRPFKLPERLAREDKTVIGSELIEQARATYAPIDDVIDQLPDHFVASEKYAPVLANL